MITTLILTLGTTSDKYLTIIRLDRSKADRYVEVNIENLSLLLVQICVVVVYGSLIKFEEMDPVHRHGPIINEPILPVLYLGDSSLHHHILLLRHKFVGTLHIEVRHIPCQLPRALLGTANLHINSLVVSQVTTPTLYSRVRQRHRLACIEVMVAVVHGVACTAKSLPSHLWTFIPIVLPCPVAIHHLTICSITTTVLRQLVLLLKNHPIELNIGVIHY